MKKFILIFLTLLMTATIMVSSCKKDVADEVDPGPSIHLITMASDTISVNTEIIVGVVGLKSPVSGLSLTRFKCSVISKNIQTTFIDSTFSSDSFEWGANIIPATDVGQVKLLFELWDKGGKRTEKSFDLTIIEHPIEDPRPYIRLKEGTGYTSGNGNINNNTAITVGVVGLKSPVSGEKLSHFKFSILFNNVSTTHNDSIFISDSFNWETNLTFTGIGDAQLLFELWDKSGNRNEQLIDLVIVDSRPILDLKAGAGYMSTDNIVHVNSKIKVGATGLKNSTSGKKLAHFKFSIVFDNMVTTMIDSLFSAESFDWDTDVTFTRPCEARLLFELWDEDGMRNERSFEIVVLEAPGVAVTRYVDVELGSFNDAVGSFFSSTEGITYTIGQASVSPAIQAKIDFLYFYGQTNKNTIASPDDPDANSIVELKLNLWLSANKNPTRFNPINMTAAQFDAIGLIYQFPTFDFGLQTTKVNNLREGDIFIFKTKDDKLGLVKITYLSTTRGDKVTATIIVQK